MQNLHRSSDGNMRDYCDGKQFKTHPLFAENNQAIQLFLYYDEFEICNPLGAKSKIHKLGKMHLVLVCFRFKHIKNKRLY